MRDYGEESRLRDTISTMVECARVFGCTTSVGREIDTITLRMCKRLETLVLDENKEDIQ